MRKTKLAAVLVLSGLKVLAQGAKGDGTFAWCTMKTVAGNVSIRSIHAPNERAKRIALWEWLHDFMHDGSWALAGDWNMAKLHDDSVGPLARLHGTEERCWKRTLRH